MAPRVKGVGERSGLGLLGARALRLMNPVLVLDPLRGERSGAMAQGPVQPKPCAQAKMSTRAASGHLGALAPRLMALASPAHWRGS